MGFWDPAGPLFIDVETLGGGYKGVFQLLFLGVTYTYILIMGCDMIGDGSELLEATPYQALIGPTILPVLGAVPDAAIVFFSGMGSDAQTQLDTGMGALAGSTVMLLTIPWVLNIVGGAVDLVEKDGEFVGNYPAADAGDESVGKGTLSDPDGWNFFTTGVTVDPEPIKSSGYWMVVTCIPYVIIQIAAFGYAYEDDVAYAKAENPYAWAGFYACMVFFVAYLGYQLYVTDTEGDEDKVAQTNERLLENGKQNLMTVLKHHLADEKTEGSSPDYGSMRDTAAGGDKSPNPDKGATPAGVNKMVLKTVQSVFYKYCTDNEELDTSPYLDKTELNVVFNKEFGIKKTAAELQEVFAEFDTDNDGQISLVEFCNGIEKMVKADDGGEEPDDVMGEALQTLAIGTLLVLLFSDPLVDVIDELGDITGIPDFYLAFLLAPMVTNGSELIASYRFAQKKTKSSITNALQQLYGAAVMNNTMTLGVFLLLIAMQGLYWDYSAESIAIVFIQLCLFTQSFYQTLTVFSGFMALSLYPLCLVLVWVLENVVGLG